MGNQGRAFIQLDRCRTELPRVKRSLTECVGRLQSWRGLGCQNAVLVVGAMGWNEAARWSAFQGTIRVVGWLNRAGRFGNMGGPPASKQTSLVCEGKAKAEMASG